MCFYIPKTTGEVLVLDFKGDLLKRKIIPAMELGMNDRTLFDIQNGKLFYLEENIDEETWELHLMDIDGDSE